MTTFSTKADILRALADGKTVVRGHKVKRAGYPAAFAMTSFSHADFIAKDWCHAE
jgi:hypothetical protein